MAALSIQRNTKEKSGGLGGDAGLLFVDFGEVAGGDVVDEATDLHGLSVGVVADAGDLLADVLGQVGESVVVGGGDDRDAGFFFELFDELGVADS